MRSGLQYCVIDNLLFPESLKGFQGINNEVKDHAQEYERLSESARTELSYPYKLRALIWELNSGSFTRLLGHLSNMEALLPDPHLRGGAYYP